jgi:hypothetical protein
MPLDDVAQQQTVPTGSAGNILQPEEQKISIKRFLDALYTATYSLISTE